jgi:hypothetical protein
MPDLEAFAEQGETKAALDRALRALAKAKQKNEDLVAAVYQAAKDATSTLTFAPVPGPPKQGSSRNSETAVVLLSDWQLAKVTPSYSTKVCEQRIEKLAEKVIALTDIQRADHPVKECRVYLLGDLIEGELIFPGQAHLVDASLYAQVLSDGPRILGGLLRKLAASFDSVRVVGVIGNHGSLGGRARRDYHPESNADAMMYEVTRLALEGEKRITWAPNSTPGERHWYATDTIGDKTFFLFHGDQIRGGFAGFPWYAFGRKLMGWRNLYGFDYAVSGHFHTPVRGYYTGDIVHWGNGSVESDNTYAAENLAASGRPSQWLLYVGKNGVTAEYEVKL